MTIEPGCDSGHSHKSTTQCSHLPVGVIFSGSSTELHIYVFACLLVLSVSVGRFSRSHHKGSSHWMIGDWR